MYIYVMFRTSLLVALILQGGSGVVLVEQDLPRNIPVSRFEGVAVYFRGGAQPPASAPLLPLTSGEVSSAEAEAIGFPQPARFQRGFCPEVFNAALVKLAREARANGANALVDVHSVDPGGAEGTVRRPSYLCMVRAVRRPAVPADTTRPPWTHSVALSGMAVTVPQR